jgi:hypothetical protein
MVPPSGRRPTGQTGVNCLHGSVESRGQAKGGHLISPIVESNTESYKRRHSLARILSIGPLSHFLGRKAALIGSQKETERKSRVDADSWPRFVPASDWPFLLTCIVTRPRSSGACPVTCPGNWQSGSCGESVNDVRSPCFSLPLMTLALTSFLYYFLCWCFLL